MNSVKALQEHGQAVWLDFLSRGFIVEGGLQELVERGRLRGVTSNPSIFEKAIGHSDEYDEAIAIACCEHRGSLVGEIYERLAVEDIKHAADVLRPVFDATHGADGFVSIEVSPYLAMDTQRTIAEAKRLWREIDRQNLMVKVPGTPAGLPAIHALIAEGINVNITLLFSRKVYEQVVEAYHVRPGGARRQGRRSVAGRKRGELLREPHRHRGRQVARRENRQDQRPRREGPPRRRSRARSRSPTPSSPTSATSGCSPASDGRHCRRTAQGRSGCSGPAPAPRTRPTATCFMSRS